MSTINVTLDPPLIFSHKVTQRVTKEFGSPKVILIKNFRKSRNPFIKGFLAAGGENKRWTWVTLNPLPKSVNLGLLRAIRERVLQAKNNYFIKLIVSTMVDCFLSVSRFSRFSFTVVNIRYGLDSL